VAEFGCLYSEVLLTRNAWEKRKLGDLGSVAMNKRIYKDQTSDEGEIPFYKIGSFGKQADAFISRKLFNEYKKLYPFPKKGDILISASGSIGRTIVYNGEDAYFQDSNIIWIQHDNRLDNTFLHQLFNIIRWSGVEGTTIKRLYNKNILSTQILLPSVEEQRSIGNLLDNVDNLIAATQHNIDALEQAKKALLQRLFDQSWRFKGYSDPWEKRKLGSLGKIKSGNGFPPREQGGHEGIPFYKVSDMNTFRNEEKMVTSQNYVTDFQVKRRKWTPISEVPAIIFAKVGAAIFLDRKRLVEQTFLMDNNMMAYILGESWNSKFCQSLFQTITLSKFAQTGALPSYNASDIAGITIFVPTNSEQKEIGLLIFKVTELIAATQSRLSSLELLKKALLQDLFI
jgi:type I restriction enzyme S subunit